MNSEFRIMNYVMGENRTLGGNLSPAGTIIAKVFLCIAAFFILGLWQSQAQEKDLFQEANAAYAEGNYEVAVEAYGQILEAGQTAAEVHYNLANSYYKLNQIGPSIYHYEKALQLDPNDSDIRNNLEFAQNMTVDAVEETQENRFLAWWDGFLDTFSTSGWATAGIVCMVLFVLLFLAYYFNALPLRKRLFFIGSMFFLVLSLGAVAFGFLKSAQLQDQNFAIIFVEEIGISSEPNARGEELFFLHEGTKVEVMEDFQGWSKIELANGNQGWIRQEAIKKL